MGDRKRFLNFIAFLTQSDPQESSGHKRKNTHRGGNVNRKNSLKFGSSRSMPRVLDNIRSKPIYEESIKQEMDYSSEEESENSKAARLKAKMKEGPIFKDESSGKSEEERQRYGSVA